MITINSFKFFNTTRWWRWQRPLIASTSRVINLNGVNHVSSFFYLPNQLNFKF